MNIKKLGISFFGAMLVLSLGSCGSKNDKTNLLETSNDTIPSEGNQTPSEGNQTPSEGNQTPSVDGGTVKPSVTPGPVTPSVEVKPSSPTAEPTINNNKEPDSVQIVKLAGDQECIYIEWKKDEAINDYQVEYKVKGGLESSYIKIDKNLIREYQDHYRADIVGISAGEYDVRVTPIKNNIALTEKASGGSAPCVAYERAGFAFSQNSLYKTGSGAYNDNGTLRSNAQVIYVTKDTAKTCQATLSAGVVTGFQSILDAKQKGDTTPLDFRLVGKVSKEDLDHISSSEEGIQIKGKNSFAELNITIEGIGEDATVYGYGFLIRNCGNVEMRNLGIMYQIDDGISIDTNNCNIWTHDNDLFYGKSGSDSDQVKGDGSIDTKNSTYVTHSFNHFWDSGKCNLQGMKNEETTNYITYHHNWYDHSDSRHPRIRTCSVHIYNNYFDGNAKYGVGVTTGASAFVESNYFRSTSQMKPMMSSCQGTDAQGEGTFSHENGGIIKSYGNKFEGAYSLITQKTTTEKNNIDCYEASTRDEVISSEYVTKQGGTTYNNFDTNASIMYTYTVQNADDAKETVVKYAGRINNGDFKFTFNNQVEDKNYTIIPELKEKIVNYKSSVVRVLGITSSSTPSTGETTTPTESGSQAGSQTPSSTPAQSINGSIVHDFTQSGLTSSVFTFTGCTLDNKSTLTYGGKTYTQALKLETSTNVTFNISKKMTITLVMTGKGNAKFDGVKKTYTSGSGTSTDPYILTLELEAGTHVITKADTGNVYLISLA